MVRVIVCVKQAIDVTQLKVDAATRKLITVDAPRKISDFDKNALEEAIRLKEKLGGEVLTLTVGPEDAKTTMRDANVNTVDKGPLAFSGTTSESNAPINTIRIVRMGRYSITISTP